MHRGEFFWNRVIELTGRPIKTSVSQDRRQVVEIDSGRSVGSARWFSYRWILPILSVASATALPIGVMILAALSIGYILIAALAPVG